MEIDKAVPPVLMMGDGDAHAPVFEAESALRHLTWVAGEYEAAVHMMKGAQMMFSRERTPAAREKNRMSNYWVSIAGRAAVFAIHEFDLAFRRAKRLANQSELCRACLDGARMREATALFHELFPEPHAARNGAAHPENRDRAEVHAVVGPAVLAGGAVQHEGDGQFFMSGMVDGVYYVTWQGQERSCPVTDAGVDRLLLVLRTLYSAFDGCAQARPPMDRPWAGPPFAD